MSYIVATKQDYIEFVEKEERKKVRRGCMIDDVAAAQIREKLARETYLLDKEVRWKLRQNKNKGQIILSIRERDCESFRIMDKIPGFFGRHCLYAKGFSLGENAYLQERNSQVVDFFNGPLDSDDVVRYCFDDFQKNKFLRSLNEEKIEIGLPCLLTKRAFVEPPQGVIGAIALFEVHLLTSKAYNFIVFQVSHQNSQKREEGVTKARELAKIWGLPQLEEESQLKRKEEREFREYDSRLILREYTSFL